MEFCCGCWEFQFRSSFFSLSSIIKLMVVARSAMAVQAAQDAGLASACHIQGGIFDAHVANGSEVAKQAPKPAALAA